MQKIAIIPISEAGIDIASTLQRQLKAHAIQRTEVGAQWKNFDAFIFIGAMGICVRTIAPYVEDKHTDPAVVCVDRLGMNAISVLSGHIGGANDLTQEVASIIGANPIITTQSDNAGLWALDTLANQFGWTLLFEAPMQDLTLNDCIYRFVNKQPTALYLRARDEGTEYMERTLPEHVTLVSGFDELKKGNFQLYIIVSPHNELLPIGIPTIHYVPRVMTLGVGLAHQAHPADEIHQEINNHIGDMGILPESIREYCTIDVKADEPYIQRQLYYGHKVRFFTADELAKVDVPNPSKTVAKHVGTPSVCEAAAILGAHHGRLVLRKLKGKNWTAAVAIDRQYERETKGHIEIVGAGPGDPDLVSVRGRKMLEKADLILYAGSLVPKALTDCHKPSAVVRSSADMNLEEQCELMKKHYDQGHFIVRLHTGDPCIFGAIQEQMAFFDQHQMSYHITPGISSFLAAAAELRSQFTIPERTRPSSSLEGKDAHRCLRRSSCTSSPEAKAPCASSSALPLWTTCRHNCCKSIQRTHP